MISSRTSPTARAARTARRTTAVPRTAPATAHRTARRIAITKTFCVIPARREQEAVLPYGSTAFYALEIKNSGNKKQSLPDCYFRNFSIQCLLWKQRL